MKFHQSPAKIRAIFGGNRSGKTTAGVVEFMMHMTGEYPDWYPKENRYPTDKPLKGRIAAQDFQKGVNEVILPTIDEWVDSTVGGSFIAKKYRNPIGIPVKWELKNGRIFDILTYEQATEQFEGWKGDIAWFDEPPPRDKYIATLRGLVDRQGRCWLTLTPLKQPWIYDEIYESDSPDIFTITMDIMENPTLSESYIKDIFSKAMDENEREARLHGKFKHLSGLVFKEFDPDVHIAEISRIRAYWTRFFAIDPHPRTPTACLWLAVDEHEGLWVYDELWMDGMSLPQMAQAIKAQEAGVTPDRRLIDPAMDKTDVTAGGFNVRKELMKHGIYCSRANNSFDLGISHIRDGLKPEYSHLYGKSIPRLRISRNCPRLIYEFQHYLWDEYTMRPEDHSEKQKPKKKNDHFLDCLRYILNARPMFRKVEQEEDIVYTGEYTKYPTIRRAKTEGIKTGYHDLIE